MQGTTYQRVLGQAERLSPEDQVRLVEDVVARVRITLREVLVRSYDQLLAQSH